MDHPQGQKEEPELDTWFREQGLAPGSPQEARLRFLWRTYLRTTGHLKRVTRDLDMQRSQHLAEMAEVRKSLEQIRVFTEHKDALAQEIQEENDQLKDQLRRLISLQDAQVSEVAKMLYQQGLTELIHSSCSEQVAYLLVERASLLEMSDVPAQLTCDENTDDPQGARRPVPSSNTGQSPHKGAARHCQSPWKRLFGRHKASQSKCTFIPTDARHFTGQANSVKRDFFHLERDLEEGSRRLAMAHSEIRRLTEELESAHLTQRAYEPELQVAQQEVKQLRQEVEKLKKYETVELRKAKEMNDRLDLEIRALRNRVRCLDADKSSLQHLITGLQRDVQWLELQQQTEQQIHTVQIKANQANDDLENPSASTCTKENTLQDQTLWKPKEAESQYQRKTRQQLQDAFKTMGEEQRAQMHKCPDYQEAGSTQTSTQDECKALQKEICEALTCLDTERSKYHEIKVKHKAKLSRTKQKLHEETMWRNEKIKSLERELSLCSHSLAKEKELVVNITEENEKLLVERRKLLQHLTEEEHSKKESNLTACLSKCRVEFLETENKKLGNTILHMSDQLGVLERTLQNMQSHHFAENLKTINSCQQLFSRLSVQTSSVMPPDPDTRHSHTKQTDLTSSPTSCIAADLPRLAEMGYLNLTSTQSSPPSLAAHSSSPSTACVSEVFHQSEAVCR